jgi:TnpA family transposase
MRRWRMIGLFALLGITIAKRLEDQASATLP